jgi:hypothetical protein
VLCLSKTVDENKICVSANCNFTVNAQIFLFLLFNFKCFSYKIEHRDLKRLDYQQEEGLMSSLSLGVNHIPIKRALTTTSTAIFVPFTTQELFMGGDSLYYGLNATSNNLIVVDSKDYINPLPSACISELFF